MPYAVGIDLGGTHIKAVAVRENGDIARQVHTHTRDLQGQTSNRESRENLEHLDSLQPPTYSPSRDSSPSTIAATISASEAAVPFWAREVKDVLQKVEEGLDEAPTCLGLCAPGLATKDGRMISSMPGRMSGLEGFSWTEYVRRPALVLNDGQAALLGEVWQGAARGVQNAFMLTLGTGVGGAIYAGGHLLKGHIGRGGHLGHFCLNPDGPPDDSGMPGSLELAIGDLSVSTRSQGRFSSTKDLVNQVIAGDDIASQIWNRSVQQLACAIASLINALDPEIVLIGGGIANAGKILYEPLDKFLGKIEWRPHGHRVPVVSSQLGEWSGAMGAAYHALRNGDT